MKFAEIVSHLLMPPIPMEIVNVTPYASLGRKQSLFLSEFQGMQIILKKTKSCMLQNHFENRSKLCEAILSEKCPRIAAMS